MHKQFWQLMFVVMRLVSGMQRGHLIMLHVISRYQSGKHLKLDQVLKYLYWTLKFIVFGNLQAIGTEEDSILFTRDFQQRRVNGGGIRFLNAQNTLSFVVLWHQNGNATMTGNSIDDQGGALRTKYAIEIEHCIAVKRNRANAGGGNLLESAADSRINSSTFIGNSTNDSILVQVQVLLKFAILHQL
ncbi:MAG: hypothetical protein IPP40_01425 [bacterium]|nr:hypothetical protein [bacterium]